MLNEAVIADGLRELDVLSEAEYDEPFSAVTAGLSLGDVESLQFERLTRLIGITLKEPFADPFEIGDIPTQTHAKRGWEFRRDENRFHEASGTWQYRTLEAIYADEKVWPGEWRPFSLYGLAEYAQHERGFFAYLAVSANKYICGDKKLKAEIEAGIGEARDAGVSIDLKSPSVFVGSVGASLATTLVSAVPSLGALGAPAIAGFAFLIYAIGIDAFCAWSNDVLAHRKRTE